MEQSVDVPGSQTRKENGEVTQRIPQVRVSEHIVEQIIDVPVPPAWEQIVAVVKASHQERVQQH